jgi:hypothetical protein
VTALFPERYDCPTCHGQDTIPAHPDEPGDGWRLPCPICWPEGWFLARSGEVPATYDPEHAEIPY